MKYRVTIKNSYSGQSTIVQAVSHKNALTKALKNAGLHWKHYPDILIERLEEKTCNQ